MRVKELPTFVATTSLHILRAVDRTLVAGSLENARNEVQEAERRRALIEALERGRGRRHPHRVA